MRTRWLCYDERHHVCPYELIIERQVSRLYLLMTRNDESNLWRTVGLLIAMESAFLARVRKLGISITCDATRGSGTGALVLDSPF